MPALVYDKINDLWKQFETTLKGRATGLPMVAVKLEKKDEKTGEILDLRWQRSDDGKWGLYTTWDGSTKPVAEAPILRRACLVYMVQDFLKEHAKVQQEAMEYVEQAVQDFEQIMEQRIDDIAIRKANRQ